jgi:hypothetical protein
MKCAFEVAPIKFPTRGSIRERVTTGNGSKVPISRVWFRKVLSCIENFFFSDEIHTRSMSNAAVSTSRAILLPCAGVQARKKSARVARFEVEVL